MTTHRCPVAGSGLTPCCGRSPLELPLDDRMTVVEEVDCWSPEVARAFAAGRVAGVYFAQAELSRMLAGFPLGGRHTRAGWAVNYLDVIAERMPS